MVNILTRTYLCAQASSVSLDIRWMILGEVRGGGGGCFSGASQGRSAAPQC